MKDTLKTFGDIIIDLTIYLVFGFLALNLLGAVLVSNAMAAEQLTYEEQVVALTILGEARGEKAVVWNGKTVGDLKHLFKSPSAPYAIRLAKAMCKGHKLVQAFTGGADHYCTLNTHNYWTRKAKPVKIIGNHKFYKLN